MEIAADRFVRMDTGWLDLATGAPARLLVEPAGSRAEQAAWSARCEALANLRHPALNPLMDFGALDATHVFEAFAAQPALAAGDRADRCLAHAVRFCEAHGLVLPRPAATCGFRPLVAGGAPGIPIGVVLQPRAALDAVSEALGATSPPGPCRVVLSGPPGSGLRTAGLLAARLARLAGYVPVAAHALQVDPALSTLLADRHVCLIEWDGTGAAHALGRLAGQGRRHLILSLARERPPGEPAVPLDAMSLRALTAMVFVDPEFPPEASAVVEAARAAAGLPARLLERLDALGRETPRPRLLVVRETAPAFPARPIVPAGERAARRTAGAMLAAQRRAERLLAQGRHAQAERTLGRAFRVLDARGFRRQAAECALLAGRLVCDRGRAAQAVDWFERARALEPEGPTGVRALIAIGGAWLLAARLVDAESALRSAHLAATALREVDLAEAAAAELAECLCLQGRPDEATGLAPFRQRPGPADSPYVAIGRATIAAASGSIPAAVRAARDARAGAAARRDPRLIVRALRLLGAALAAAGDQGQAAECLDEGIAMARANRLPIDVLRLRAARAALEGAMTPRTINALRRCASGAPRLVQIEIRVACACAAGDDVDAETRRWIEAQGVRRLPAAPIEGPMTILERFLERCRAASDDRDAVEQVCADLLVRLRAGSVLVFGAPPADRVLVHHGRPWAGEPTAARRVLATGAALSPDPAVEPSAAAEPLRFGGDVIGALACRWPPGTPFDPARAAAVMRAAALAISAHVRALLDRSLVNVHAPAAAGELLGDSAAARTLREAIGRAARAPFPVLIEGGFGPQPHPDFIDVFDEAALDDCHRQVA